MVSRARSWLVLVSPHRNLTAARREIISSGRNNFYLSWAVTPTPTCDDVLKGTSDPIVLQGPNRRSQQDLDYRFGTARVAAARRAYEGITNALSNESLLYKIYDIGSPSLAMVEVRRHYVPSEDLDKQAYQRESTLMLI